MNKYQALYVFLMMNIEPDSSQPIFVNNTVDHGKNMFYKINAILQSLTNKIFTVLELSEESMKTYNTGVLLQMHRHLKIITENNYDIYMDIMNGSRIDPYTNNSVFNMTETVRQVLDNDYEMFDEDRTINRNDSTYTQNEGNNGLKTIEFIKNPLQVIESTDFNMTEPFNGTVQSFVKSRRRVNVWKRYDLKKWDPSTAIEYLNDPNNTRRVYNGISTKIEKYPFIVSIHVAEEFTCAGSIIAKDLVITAASCLQAVYNNSIYIKSSVSLSARVGSVYSRRHGTVLPILEVYFHPDYNSEQLRNNIALARVPGIGKTPGARRIVYERAVHPLPEDTVIAMLGWGDRDEGVSGDLSPLAVTQISLYNIQDCKEAYTANYVNDQNFCAGYTTKGHGACSRDLGGPGIIRGVLTGVISFGPPVCGTPDAPTVFTRIGHYSGWIDDIAKGENYSSTDAPELSPFTANIEPKPQHLQESRKFQLPLAMEFLKSVLNNIIITAENDVDGPKIEIKNTGNELSRFLDIFKNTFVKETTKKALVVNKSTPNLNIQRTGADTADNNPDWVAFDEYTVTATVNWDWPDRPHDNKHKKHTIMNTVTNKPIRDPPKLSTIKDPKFIKEIKNVESFLASKYVSKIRHKLMAAADYDNVDNPNREKTTLAKNKTEIKLQVNDLDETEIALYNNFETDCEMSKLADEEPFSGQFSLAIDDDVDDNIDDSHMHSNNKFDETKLRLGVNINT